MNCNMPKPAPLRRIVETGTDKEGYFESLECGHLHRPARVRYAEMSGQEPVRVQRRRCQACVR